ncbi:MAG TPA: NAD(P)-dependent oxidoreductase [Candidatus Acidoferrales bacterium]|jgi:3-hydroxyisobutyrate dehydrogenase|nr:NAD(P)-dependent oxidoreductase [Candidatus Acidoferrales bacterium]
MRVGFIGIGNMGWPMASHIAQAGHELMVFDVDAARSARFAQEFKCKAAAGLAEVAANEMTVTMLPTGKIVRQALLEDQGGAFAKALKPGALVIDMSSSEPVGTRELGVEIAKRGAVLIDAPVSGAVPRAKAGTLAIMIGGDNKAAIERAKPLLQAMGKQLFETGPLGTGHAMKALNNYIAAAGYTAVVESLLIGERFGLDQGTMVDILNVSTGRNFTTEVMIKEQVLGGKFATGFALGLMAKDVKIAADLGEAVKLDAPVSRLIRDRWALARERLGATRDTSEAILSWKDDLPARNK